jgi:transcriptional regulator with XRE-family HTH domain
MVPNRENDKFMHRGRLPEINGIALKAAREKRGIERSELATQCCLSSKMVAELEDGGISYFYSYQLKVSAAKRVGSYLGLSTEDFLQQVAEVIENVDALEDGENESLQEGGMQDLASTVNGVVNEGEQLDDLIYESTNSGTSLPHVSVRTSQFKWVGGALFVLVGMIAMYGLESQFHISNQSLEFFGKSNNQNMQPPEPPKELVAEYQEQIQGDAKPSIKTEAKIEPMPAASLAANQCSPVRDDQLLVYKSPNPSKSGDTLNIKTLVKQSVCVIDSQGKQALVDLDSNEAHSFRGNPPFVVVAQDLDNVEMFYQGWRVRLPNAGMKQMKLVEVAVQ